MSISALVGPEQNYLILHRKIEYSGITIKEYDYLVCWWIYNIIELNDTDGEEWKDKV